MKFSGFHGKKTETQLSQSDSEAKFGPEEAKPSGIGSSEVLRASPQS